MCGRQPEEKKKTADHIPDPEAITPSARKAVPLPYTPRKKNLRIISIRELKERSRLCVGSRSAKTASGVVYLDGEGFLIYFVFLYVRDGPGSEHG